MTNRIRYPYPNRLGLIKPPPYVETIAGRVIDNGVIERVKINSLDLLPRRP